MSVTLRTTLSVYPTYSKNLAFQFCPDRPAWSRCRHVTLSLGQGAPTGRAVLVGFVQTGHSLPLAFSHAGGGGGERNMWQDCRHKVTHTGTQR